MQEWIAYIISQYSPLSSAARAVLLRILVLATYIKRHKDMVVSADRSSALPVGLLEGALRESCGNLPLAEIGGNLYVPQTDLPLSVGAALAAYDLFEDALETGLETPASFFALMTVWFLILSALLFYLLRAVEHRRSVRWMAAALGFVLLFAALCALYDTDWLDAAPLWLLWTVAALAAAAAAALLLYGAGRDKQRITRASIKEAMDDLPVGGCYFNARGTVKLCNRQMQRLFYAMSGRDLQPLDELHAAMQNWRDRGRMRPDGGYTFPDGKVWYFMEWSMVTKDAQHYTETVFTDATEFSAANEALARDNQY